MDIYNKHYIRLDNKGSVIKVFSDAFEQPETNDICVNEQGGRQFEHKGVENPPIFNMQGQPLYHYTQSDFVEWADRERNTLYPILAPEPTEIEKLREQINIQQTVIDTLAQDILPNIIEMIG